MLLFMDIGGGMDPEPQTDANIYLFDYKYCIFIGSEDTVGREGGGGVKNA